MKKISTLFALVVAVLSSVSVFAQNQRVMTLGDNVRYEGAWPEGEGVLYSPTEGLVLGTFVKGKPDGKCICYKPNGDVYWGDFKKGKATGHGYLFHDEGDVVSGGFKNGKLHGADTIYRVNRSVLIGNYKKGELVETVYETDMVPGEMLVKKPSYPRIDFRHRQEEFLNEMEAAWQNKTMGIKQTPGFVHPKFQNGTVDDFILWVNSQVQAPAAGYMRGTTRTVLVEFTVLTNGSVADVHAVFGSDISLNEEAERIVRTSPKWVPGERNGKKLGVRMTIPVVFNME